MSGSPQPDANPRPGLEDLYRNHVEFAWRTVRYLGVPHADAQDVVHEVFIIVQRRLADYDGRASARAWIAGITRRVVMHHHRSQARTQKRTASLDPPSNTQAAPDETISRLEAGAFLESFLDGLPEKKREAFVLGELEGLSVPEIAEMNGDNRNTIQSRLRSARQAFQASVDRREAVRSRESG